jgi:hypothetical protein
MRLTWPWIFINRKRWEEHIQAEIATRVAAALQDERRWETTEDAINKDTAVITTPSVSVFEVVATSVDAINLKEGVSDSAQWASMGGVTGIDARVEQTDSDRIAAQVASSLQWALLPIARSIIENYKRYVIGKGIKINCIEPTVLAYLKRFWQQNSMEQRLKIGFRDLLLDGELFWAFFEQFKLKDFNSDTDTAVVVRRFPAGQITEVEYDPEDYESRLSYTRDISGINSDKDKEIYLDVFHPYDDVPSDVQRVLYVNKNVGVSTHKVEAVSSRMLMMKLGLTFDRRGRVFMESVLRWNRIFTDFTFDRGQLNHLRAKIFLIETRSIKAGVISAASYDRMPKGGVKLIETNDRKYRMESPNTGAGDAKEDASLILHMIAAGVSMPDYILVQDASNNNYASIREAGTPFVQAVMDLQDDYAEYVRQMLRYVLLVGIRSKILAPVYTVTTYPGDTIGEVMQFVRDRLAAGYVPEQVLAEAETMLPEKQTFTINTLDMPIELIFPEIVSVNIDTQAATLKVYRELGIMSRHTAIQKIGLNPDTEIARITREDEEAWAKNQERFNQTASDMGKGGAGEDTADNSDDENVAKKKPNVTKESFAIVGTDEDTCSVVTAKVMYTSEGVVTIKRVNFTEQFIEVRLRNFLEFKTGIMFDNSTFATINIDTDKGISATVGVLTADSGSVATVQSFLFETAKGWDAVKARAWVRARAKSESNN